VSVSNAQSENGLTYDLSGHGPTIVLIHGTNLDRRMWSDDADWLQHQATVLRYDLRGQGSSAYPVEKFSNHGDLIALLEELKVESATLVGLSAGVQVALDVALEAPQLVQNLVLVSPSLMGHAPTEMPAFFTDLSAALKSGDFAKANEVLLASSIMAVPPKHSDLVRTMVTENESLWTFPYPLVEIASPPAIQRLEEIQTRTLILDGENDLTAIGEQAELLAERLPRAVRITIPDGGHLLNLTSPDEFRTALNEFFDAAADSE
jgi:pimeloyl-ACP methyl ester carboxylesterase